MPQLEDEMAIRYWMCFLLSGSLVKETISLTNNSSAYFDKCQELSFTDASSCIVKEDIVSLSWILRQILQSLEWRSLTFVHDDSGDLTVQYLIHFISDHVLVSVFQKTDSTNATSNSTISYSQLFSYGVPKNFVVLGQTDFVITFFREVLIYGGHIVTFSSYWLTVVPRDIQEPMEVVSHSFEHFAMVVAEEEDTFTLRTQHREGDATELTSVREWSSCSTPNASDLDTDLVFPNSQHGLGGRTLRMVTMVWEPFIIRNVTGNKTQYTGLCIDLLEYMARRLNFTNHASIDALDMERVKIVCYSYVISEPPDKSWGHQLPNGTWVGMTAMLKRKEADFALAGMSVTSDRAAVSDYTEGFYYDELVLLVSRPTEDMTWTFFFRPFHWHVYTALGGCLVAVTAVFVCLIKLGNFFSLRQPQVIRNHRKPATCVDSVPAVIETLFGALLGRTVTHTWRQTPGGRVLLSSWFLLSLVMVTTYTANLTAFSVLTRQKVPFSTLRQLVKRDDYRWGFLSGTMLETILPNSNNEDYLRFYRGALEFAEDDPSVLSPDTDVQMAKVSGGNYVFLGTLSIYAHYKAKYCQLTFLSETLYTDAFAVHLQKDSPYTKLFNKVIEDAKELGLVDYWSRKRFPNNRRCGEDKAEVMSLSLEHVQSAFMMAGLGLGTASFVFGTECLIRQWSQVISRHQRT